MMRSQQLEVSRSPQLPEDAIPHLAIMMAMGQVVSSKDQSEQQGATTPPSLYWGCTGVTTPPPLYFSASACWVYILQGTI